MMVYSWIHYYAVYTCVGSVAMRTILIHKNLQITTQFRTTLNFECYTEILNLQENFLHWLVVLATWGAFEGLK